MKIWQQESLFVAVVVVFVILVGALYLYVPVEEVAYPDMEIIFAPDADQQVNRSEKAGDKVVSLEINSSETNIEKSRRLAVENKAYAKRVPELEREARDKGWNIRKSATISTGEYGYFLERLLLVEEVVNTEEVEVLVSRWFSVAEGTVFIPYDAEMEEILNFLKN